MSTAARILSNPSTSLRDWTRFSLAAATALLDCDGDRETADHHLRTARTALSLVDLPSEAAVLRLQEARAAVRDAEHDRALTDLDRLDSCTDDLTPHNQAMYWSVRARALEGLGRIDEAIAALRHAVEFAESLGAYRIAAGHWREIDRLRSR
jgi:tetratricopeptide (TPR) repeat protein